MEANAYEIARARRIEQNNLKLAELGLHLGFAHPAGAASDCVAQVAGA